MARPKPNVLCTYEKSSVSIDILKTAGVWGVTHLGELVSMRYRQHGVNGETNKYPKTMFPSRASAVNCARRLNAIFETDAFSISRLQCDITEYTEPPVPDLTDYENLEPN
jgi:hypothetical protein